MIDLANIPKATQYLLINVFDSSDNRIEQKRITIHETPVDDTFIDDYSRAAKKYLDWFIDTRKSKYSILNILIDEFPVFDASPDFYAKPPGLLVVFNIMIDLAPSQVTQWKKKLEERNAIGLDQALLQASIGEKDAPHDFEIGYLIYEPADQGQYRLEINLEHDLLRATFVDRLLEKGATQLNPEQIEEALWFSTPYLLNGKITYVTEPYFIPVYNQSP